MDSIPQQWFAVGILARESTRDALPQITIPRPATRAHPLAITLSHALSHRLSPLALRAASFNCRHPVLCLRRRAARSSRQSSTSGRL